MNTTMNTTQFITNILHHGGCIVRIVLGTASAALIAFGAFEAGATYGAAQGLENLEESYTSGYSAGYEAATENLTVDGWKLNSITAPDGTKLYCIDDMQTGNGYAIFIAREDELELMTSETPRID